jgi:hypothetical protein
MAPTTGRATTTTHPGVFPPADPDTTVCGAISQAEAERLVGHPLPNPPVQPLAGQCAWPDKPGEVVGDLYFVVKERDPVLDLRGVLERDWEAERFRFEALPGLGDEAWYVVKRADPAEETREFVEGLEVYGAFDTHLVLGNGGRDSWVGDGPAVRARLAALMERVLERIEARVVEGRRRSGVSIED